MDFLAATRTSYDALADAYLEAIDPDLAAYPLDRAVFEVFARQVRDGGLVADVGCGPGWLTARLREWGADAFGIDLSPAMVETARRTYPGIRFEVGSMLGLDLPDGSLGGVLSALSIIHVPWERRAEVFAEFHRVLEPDGQLLVAFHVGDHVLHRDESMGRKVDLDSYRQQPADIVRLLEAAGFAVWAEVVRRPDAKEKVPKGFVLASKTPPTGVT